MICLATDICIVKLAQGVFRSREMFVFPPTTLLDYCNDVQK